MSLEKIYVVRHGFRAGWSVDPFTGTYSSSVPSPTGNPVDPALTAHGVEQAGELARHLAILDPPVGAVYSSPYYRCLQTLRPFTDTLLSTSTSTQPHQTLESATRNGTGNGNGTARMIRPEYGLCEWFGSAPFAHPGPASRLTLQAMFPTWDASYESVSGPPPARGETLEQLRLRVEETVAGVVARCDAEGVRGVLLCTHAAVVIMLGRVLSEEEDFEFDAFTCGLSVYRRRGKGTAGTAGSAGSAGSAGEDQQDVCGAWVCEANSDCTFLSHGAERGWRFSGDEDFPGAESRSKSSTHTHKL